MKPLELWTHELRRAGPATLVGPPALVLLMAVLAIFGARLGSRESNTAFMLLASLEMAIPLMTGMAAASSLGRDHAVELQLTMPVGYRSTLLRRLAVTVGWTGLCALAGSALLAVGGWWELVPGAPRGLAVQLTWLAPALWLAALGLLASAAFGGTVAATTTVAFVWVAEQVFAGPLQASLPSRLLYLFATTRGTVPDDWTANRIVLLCTAIPLVAAAWLLLGHAERVLGGEKE
ncbi:hypothetical protein IMZ11_37530 [Microtetraspora sp. AC03309]|uniref:hypothetical protein n=1 Tax=Microtetraspora sp. AC03309 TaxID=2779376 RepID=UPI001E51E204|nr:hypothetical protein [Microtetraspora sp. AC03309]MCC5581322.1 hypothetical protein [Microtetraspora sp. AC03309]